MTPALQGLGGAPRLLPRPGLGHPGHEADAQRLTTRAPSCRSPGALPSRPLAQEARPWALLTGNPPSVGMEGQGGLMRGRLLMLPPAQHRAQTPTLRLGQADV